MSGRTACGDKLRVVLASSWTTEAQVQLLQLGTPPWYIVCVPLCVDNVLAVMHIFCLRSTVMSHNNMRSTCRMHAQ